MSLWRYPVPYAEEPLGMSGRCRVIVQDGRFTKEATAEDRKLLAAKVQNKRKRGPGRPGRLAHLRPVIEQLRRDGFTWREIGTHLGANPEAARMVVTNRKKAKAA